MPENLNKSNYWQTLVSELIKCIPTVPTENPHKGDKTAYVVSHHNRKTYAEKYGLVELEKGLEG